MGKAVRKEDIPDPVQREINPQFMKRLPHIMEQICQSLIVLDPEMERVSIQLRELYEYLDFEIEKVTLEISKEEWKDKVDRAKLDDSREWVAKLKQLRTDFDVDRMTSSVELIHTNLSKIRKMFGPYRPV